MTTISFWCPIEKLRQLQDLVKSTDSRFVSVIKPTTELFERQHSQYVIIEFDTMEKYTKFTDAWDRAHVTIKETKSPRWKQILRRMFG